jgi:hypothetical protein
MKMLNPLWYFSFSIPICGGIALGIIVDAGVLIEYQTLVFFLVGGWAIISLYSGCKIALAWIRKTSRNHEEFEPREKYFEVLNAAYDIKDRLKLLEKDTGRNIDRIHNMGKEAGYYDKPSR